MTDNPLLAFARQHGHAKRTVNDAMIRLDQRFWTPILKS